MYLETLKRAHRDFSVAVSVELHKEEQHPLHWLARGLPLHWQTRRHLIANNKNTCTSCT